MLLFCYGANTNVKYVASICAYTFVCTGFVSDKVLTFNHLGMFANMKFCAGARLHGIVIELCADSLRKIKRHEFLYHLVNVTVVSSEGTHFKASTFQSLLTLPEIAVPQAYEKLMLSGYIEHGLPVPKIHGSRRARVTLAINIVGVIVGIILIQFKQFQWVGWLLVVVDFMMIVDQVMNKFAFKQEIQEAYPTAFFIAFKVIPPFLIAPYVFANTTSRLLQLLMASFFVVDVLIIYVEYIQIKNTYAHGHFD